MKLIATVALVVVAAAAAVWGTSALEEQAHDRELFAAYCMGVFGPVQSSLKSPSVPACLTNEPADECSARIADVDRERQRVDLKLRQLQESLATQGVIVPDHYTMLAKYLVATSCREGYLADYVSGIDRMCLTSHQLPPESLKLRMAQANLKYLVEDADLRVQRTRRCLDRQREAVSTLERGGLDATLAKRLLTISEKAFEIHVADRVRLTQRTGKAVARSKDIWDRQDQLASVKI